MQEFIGIMIVMTAIIFGIGGFLGSMSSQSTKEWFMPSFWTWVFIITISIGIELATNFK